MLFDFEVFPQWWCVCFRSSDEPSFIYVVSSDVKGYVELLRGILQKYRLIGFNCKMYDLIIYNAILSDQSPESVYQVSQDLIHDVKTKWTSTFNHYRWDWIDLYNDWKYGSLKMYEANSGMSIKESSVPFGKMNLTEDEKLDIINYCHADTMASYQLWLDRKDYFGIHEFVSKRYGVPPTKAFQKTMASLTAEAMKTNKPTDIFPEDKRKSIYVLDYIESVLHTDPFNYLLVDSKAERNFTFDGDKFILGVGGVHSTLFEPQTPKEKVDGVLTIAESNRDMQIWTIDFTQYYPNMLTKFDLMPRSVPVVGVQCYEDMIVKVKSLKEAINAESDSGKAAIMNSERDKYKVLINAVSGAMRSKYSKFYDPARIITMCATGQFLLIAIAVDLKKSFPGSEIIQTNTDGLYMYVPTKYDVQCKMDEIMHNIKFDIEVEKADKIIQHDVNNYILLHGKKAKTKGSWCYEKRSKYKPLFFPVCRKAVFEYFVHGTPIEDTVRNDRDIMDFVRCVKTGSASFDETVLRVGDVDVPTNMTNRFIASTKVKNASLLKVKNNADGTKSYVSVSVSVNNCMLLNDTIDSYNFDELGIDYDFYIKFAKGLIPDTQYTLQ